MLNGADGLGEIAAGLVGQGLTILDSVRQNLSGSGEPRPDSRSGAQLSLPGLLSGKAGPEGKGDGPVDID